MSRLADVALVHSDGNYAEALPRLLDLLGARDLIRPGESVLVKPNLHALADWRTGSVTNPALVAAVLDWARDCGAGELTVAEGPFYGLTPPERVFTENGIAEVAEARGARWLPIDRAPFRSFANADPALLPVTRLSELAFTHDRVLSVALAKTHMDCQVTLGMKNLKGLLHPQDKARFHQEVDLDRALVALNRLVRPDLTLVDGTIGMEGLGPHAGTPANWGVLFAGYTAEQVDAVVAPAMGFSLEEVRTLRYAIEQGLLDPATIRLAGEDPAAVTRRFERPYEAMLRELPGLKLRGAAACSACKLNLIRSLCEEVGAGRPLPAEPLLIGKESIGEEQALLLGKCAGQANPGRPHLPGCPPRVDQIKQYLRELGPEGRNLAPA